ncbi:hypothetical protein F511_34682 [Dorcoceras hygrometricum]|uniref:Uncharacterized protein n=1 Tax=Dorcoceras hygrometricum TaxID=472368 RepID=A0A2Z7B4M6_9LAMI|nr:hypothetical protein F511_34682 [Dorcoceras hygrometricum]
MDCSSTTEKGVLADGLDEVSEWTKWKSKHTMALDENNGPELNSAHVLKDEKPAMHLWTKDAKYKMSKHFSTATTLSPMGKSTHQAINNKRRAQAQDDELRREYCAKCRTENRQMHNT